ncbi:hypothetical protein ACL6C3_13955 [Capilliphycus salinus ALCB114379]|uniref:hypothetical protein n=1 Tax=Capilliphycus salinus TaxID=2768948 RepID=UPI0039A418C6
MNEVTREKQEILCLVTLTPGKGLLDQVREIERDMNDDSRFNVEIEYVRSNNRVGELIQGATPSPHIIHIAAESPKDGEIEIPDTDNEKIYILKPNILAGFFSNTKNINCVLLNFCYSKRVAELIEKSEFEKSDGVQCVIAIDHRIEIEGAAAFSSSFYKALKGNLLNSKIIQEAFEKGKAAADDRKTEGEGEYCIFQKQIKQPEMQLVEPSEGSNISRNCQFTGTFKNLPDGASMWAYVNATLQRKFYLVPIDDYRSDGTWFKEVIVGEQNDTNSYRIGVLIVEQKETQQLNDTFSRLGILSLDNLPNGSLKFGDRAVRRQ